MINNLKNLTSTEQTIRKLALQDQDTYGDTQEADLNSPASESMR